MTSHCITWHDTTQAITSHQMTWPSRDLTPQQTLRHQNTSLQSTRHHHHGTAEGSLPCAHSIGKFFLCYIVLFLLETSAPGLSGHYWYKIYDLSLVLNVSCHDMSWFYRSDFGPAKIQKEELAASSFTPICSMIVARRVKWLENDTQIMERICFAIQFTWQTSG